MLSIYFGTIQECDHCHSTTAWAPIDFTHLSRNYPGDHNSAVTCIRCHRDGTESINYPSPGYLPDCAACHAGDYDAGEHRGTLNDNRDCGGSGCHRVSSRSF